MDADEKVKALAFVATHQFCDAQHDSPNEPWPYLKWLEGEYEQAIWEAVGAVTQRVEQDDPIESYRAEAAEDRRDDAEWESRRLEPGKNLAA